MSGWFLLGNLRVLVTFVCASCFQRKCIEVWDFLNGHDLVRCPWFIEGGGILILF